MHNNSPNEMERKTKNEKMTIFVALILIASSLIFLTTAGVTAQPSVASAPANLTPWTYPTTTMQEPGYTGGVYKMAATNSVEHLNIWQTTDLYSFMLLDEIYDSPTVLAPNETVLPWLATSWMEKNVTGQNITTFDPINGTRVPVRYEWIVNIRPGVQWTDWTPQNQNATYVYSNHTVTSTYSHTFKSFPSMTMRKYYVQSADFILSWEILQSALDFSGSYTNVVNVIPLSNLTVQYDLIDQSATFLTYTLETDILPYHIWVNHDWSTTDPAAFNYTGAPNGYDSWNMNYNPSNFTATGLVGTGPFMMYNNYGEPYGQWVPDEYWSLYVNPHYFVQYVPSLEQYTPKFYELYTPQYLSLSAAVTAESLGQVYTIEEGVPPTFIPTVDTMKSTYIYEKPSTSYGYIQINSYNSDAPFNYTSVRQALNYATNKAYIATVIDEGYTILGQPVVPVSDSVWHNFSTPQYSYNPAKAMALLNSTPGMKYVNGQYYYNGKPVTANMQITVASEDPLGVEAALVIANEWDAIGIPTTVTQEAFTTLVSNLITYSYQMINLGITGVFGDPTGDFLSFYNTQGLGTGFYLGPFTNITYAGVNYTGQQITDLMNNLTVELNTITNFTERLSIADEIEGIAAIESTMINLGYPVDILPFTNSTFTGVIRDTLPYSSFMWWNFLSLHLKTTKTVTVTKLTTTPMTLHVTLVSPNKVYYNGQYGNVTIQVRNQYGQPVSGASVSVGYSPQGALLNISSDSGTTNSAGQYIWEFKVLKNNPLTYTADYVSEINISASASYSSSTTPYTTALGYTFIDVSPQEVAYSVSGPAVISNNSKWSYYNITVYNPVTSAPIPGYKYTVQALSGAVELLNTSSQQSLIQVSSYNPVYGFGFQAAYVNQLEYNSTLKENVTVPVIDYNLTSLSGVTSSNGLISFKIAVNPDTNYTMNGGSTFLSYIFLGNYAAGAPVTGEPPYAVIGEQTSATNPSGFGVLQPTEIPISVSSIVNNVTISISAPSQIAYNGVTNVTVTVTGPNGPIPNYGVTLVSQNSLGANRGFFSSSSGVQTLAYNPNEFFGSRFLPGINVITNSTGQATVSFSAGLYNITYSPNGSFAFFTPEAFTDQYLVPEDEFQISALGSTGVSATTTIVSSQYENNVPPTMYVAAFVNTSNVYNNVVTIMSNKTYTLYLNGTLGSPYGPLSGNIPVTLSVSAGTLSSNNVTIPSSGSISINYVAPNVTVLSPVVLTLSYNGTKSTETFYVIPTPPSIVHTVTQYVNRTVNVTHTVTVTSPLVYVFGVLMVVFLITTVVGFTRRKKPAEVKNQ